MATTTIVASRVDITMSITMTSIMTREAKVKKGMLEIHSEQSIRYMLTAEQREASPPARLRRRLRDLQRLHHAI